MLFSMIPSFLNPHDGITDLGLGRHLEGNTLLAHGLLEEHADCLSDIDAQLVEKLWENREPIR